MLLLKHFDYSLYFSNFSVDILTGLLTFVFLNYNILVWTLLIMLDFILMLQVASLFVDRIHSQITSLLRVWKARLQVTQNLMTALKEICVLYINDTSIAIFYITCLKTFCCLPLSTSSPFLRILLLP